MTGTPLAAMLLAAAALLAPPPPIARLQIPTRRTAAPLTASAAAAVIFGIWALSASLPLVLALLIAAGTLALRLRGRIRRQRRRREGSAMAAALDVLIGELRVGAHPMSAFAVAGAETGGSVGRALKVVATTADLGADVAAGIRAVADASVIADYWGRLAVFWHLAAEHGLPMSDLMHAAHRDIVDRQLFSDRMQASLAGARATAVILATLPVFGVLLGQLVGADPVGFLLGGGIGGVVLVVGVGLASVGVLWADKIVDRLAG